MPGGKPSFKKFALSQTKLLSTKYPFLKPDQIQQKAKQIWSKLPKEEKLKYVGSTTPAKSRSQNTPSSDSKLENRKRYIPKYGSSKDWMLDWQSPEAKHDLKNVVSKKKKRVTISSPHLFGESNLENGIDDLSDNKTNSSSSGKNACAMTSKTDSKVAASASMGRAPLMSCDSDEDDAEDRLIALNQEIQQRRLDDGDDEVYGKPFSDSDENEGDDKLQMINQTIKEDAGGDPSERAKIPAEEPDSPSSSFNWPENSKDRKNKDLSNKALRTRKMLMQSGIKDETSSTDSGDDKMSKRRGTARVKGTPKGNSKITKFFSAPEKSKKKIKENEDDELHDLTVEDSDSYQKVMVRSEEESQDDLNFDDLNVDEAIKFVEETKQEISMNSISTATAQLSGGDAETEKEGKSLKKQNELTDQPKPTSFPAKKKEQSLDSKDELPHIGTLSSSSAKIDHGEKSRRRSKGKNTGQKYEGDERKTELPKPNKSKVVKEIQSGSKNRPREKSRQKKDGELQAIRSFGFDDSGDEETINSEIKVSGNMEESKRSGNTSEQPTEIAKVSNEEDKMDSCDEGSTTNTGSVSKSGRKIRQKFDEKKKVSNASPTQKLEKTRKMFKYEKTESDNEQDKVNGDDMHDVSVEIYSSEKDEPVANQNEIPTITKRKVLSEIKPNVTKPRQSPRLKAAAIDKLRESPRLKAQGKLRQRKTPRAKAPKEEIILSSSSQESTTGPELIPLNLASFTAALAKMKQSRLARLPSDTSDEKTQSPPPQPSKGMSVLDQAIASMRAVAMPEMKLDDTEPDSQTSQVSSANDDWLNDGSSQDSRGMGSPFRPVKIYSPTSHKSKHLKTLTHQPELSPLVQDFKASLSPVMKQTLEDKVESLIQMKPLQKTARKSTKKLYRSKGVENISNEDESSKVALSSFQNAGNVNEPNSPAISTISSIDMSLHEKELGSPTRRCMTKRKSTGKSPGLNTSLPPHTSANTKKNVRGGPSPMMKSLAKMIQQSSTDSAGGDAPYREINPELNDSKKSVKKQDRCSIFDDLEPVIPVAGVLDGLFESISPPTKKTKRRTLKKGNVVSEYKDGELFI